MPAPSVALGLFGVQFGTLITALGFTKATSLWRPALLPILFLVPYLQLPHLDAITYAPARGVLGGATIFTVVLYVATVLIHKFSYVAQGPTSSAGGLVPTQRDELVAGQQRNGNSGRVLARLRFGLEIGAGARFAATKWPVNNIPPFSRDDPSFIPTRAEFQRSLAPKVVLSWLLLMALNFVPPNNDSQTSFASRRIPILSRLNAVESEEIYTRFGAVLGYWLVQYILHIAVHGSMAMAAVALGFEVAAWPPIFGAATDCYTIRRFWGRFWHQSLRHGCSSIAYAATYHGLSLRRRGIVGRYVFTLLTFTVSGIFHVLLDIAQGIPWNETGALRFFTMQTLGIMLEDFIVTQFRLARGSRIKKTLLKLLGYAWVISWLVWCSPIWVYPLVRMSTDDPIVPIPAQLRVAISRIIAIYS